MKLRKLSYRKWGSVKRCDPLMKRLALYSATAGAALLAAPGAEATIQNITTFSYDGGSSFGSTPPNDSNSGGTNLNFTAATAGHNAGFVGFLEVNNGNFGFDSGTGIARIGGHVANHTFSGMASKLVFGASVMNRVFFNVNGEATLASRHLSSSFGLGPGPGSSRGNFLPHGAGATVTGYVGFKTNLRGQTYYGWLRVKVSNDGSDFPFEVSLISKNGDPSVFGAYGLASDNITAGETALAAPEPSVAAIAGLGLLALGARGVREWRRRRAAVQK